MGLFSEFQPVRRATPDGQGMANLELIASRAYYIIMGITGLTVGGLIMGFAYFFNPMIQTILSSNDRWSTLVLALIFLLGIGYLILGTGFLTLKKLIKVDATNKSISRHIKICGKTFRKNSINLDEIDNFELSSPSRPPVMDPNRPQPTGHWELFLKDKKGNPYFIDRHYQKEPLERLKAILQNQCQQSM